jgi:hypothetical protein
MYATIHALPSTGSTEPRDVVAACLPAGAEPAGSLVADHLEASGGTVVVLWADESAAASTGERVYRVSDEMHGRAAGRRPLFAQITWLNGDGDQERADAAERGGRDRIWPAVREIDGIVGALALRSADDRIVVIGLSTGTETYDQVQRTVMATELLPDEDPALLPGHDRIEHARVLLVDLPTEVRS